MSTVNNSKNTAGPSSQYPIFPTLQQLRRPEYAGADLIAGICLGCGEMMMSGMVVETCQRCTSQYGEKGERS